MGLGSPSATTERGTLIAGGMAAWSGEVDFPRFDLPDLGPVSNAGCGDL